MIKVLTDNKKWNCFPSTWPEVYKLIPETIKKKKILNAGAGSHRFQLENYNIFNVDKGNYENSKVVDLNKDFSFPDNSFDGVLSIEVIEHLENPFHFLRELKRVSKDWIIVTTPNNLSPASMLKFQKEGCFRWFSSKWFESGHISILFDWQLEGFFQLQKLIIETKTYNDKLNQEILIYKLRVKNLK